MTTSILIVGATGKQGGAALSSLLSSPSSPSLSLRFLTRNPDSPSAKRLVANGATAIKGDLDSPASLAVALKGVERAFVMTDVMAGEIKEAAQGKNFVDAAKAAGVGHVVFTSAGGADVATSVPHFRSKYEVEKHLQSSGISYTILRPVAFMDNFPVGSGLARATGVGGFFSFIGGKPCQFIACQDIGVFAAKALLSPTDPFFANKTIDLSAGSWDLESTRAAIKAAQGQTPRLAGFIPSAARGLLPHDMKMMFAYFEKTGFPQVDVAALKRIHPGMKSMEDYFRV